MFLAEQHHRSRVLGAINVLEGGRRSPFLWKRPGVIKAAREDDEREARREGKGRPRVRARRKQTGGESEREAGLRFPAIANHLSLAALTPQLLLVQSTVTGREPAKRLRKTPTQPLHIRGEAKKKQNVFGTNQSLRLEPERHITFTFKAPEPPRYIRRP